MLQKVNIKNLAIIDDLEIQFNPSFNVVTGESGSGKTIIYKSINYLFGEKFNKDEIRKGESECRISGLLSIDSSLYEINRAFTKSSTKNFINGKNVNKREYLNFMKNIWESYGQHEQQLLLNKSNHIKYIDLFLGENKLLNEYSILYNKFLMINEEIEKIIILNDDYSKNKELYEFQLKELEDIDFEIDEDNILKEKIDKLEKSKNISDYLNALYTIDSSSSALLTLLDNTYNILESETENSEDIKKIVKRLSSLKHEFSDIQYEASKISKEYYYDSSELDTTQKKLINVNHLKRKYGGSVESILEYRNNLKSKINNSIDADKLLKEKIDYKNTIKKEALEKASILLEKRQETAKKLEKNIKADLALMEMRGIEFSVRLGDVEINESGIEECVFNIRTNKGESIKSIGDIVSGGELSRIMMAIKLSINTSSENKIFILDEIDAGLSGKEADSIGNIIKRLSNKNQVICITHLSQIASKAKEHFKISKAISNSRTLCNIETLNENEKIKELATMISGKDITSQSIDYAKKILDHN